MAVLDDATRAPARHRIYALMRLGGRAMIVRRAVTRARQWVGRRSLESFLRSREAALASGLFAPRDPRSMVSELHDRGIALGVDLPSDVVEELRDHALATPCYADRDPTLGFAVDDRARVEEALGKPILVAQHFNVLRDCPAAARVADDPLVQTVAASYLGAVPRLVGTSLWWTFPVDATDADRDRHAHQWHRDLDDFDFVKFFFYLTPVEPDDGAHMCVAGSHRDAHGRPRRQAIRRHTDAEVGAAHRAEDILEICGPAGTGFAETTLCLHKGRTPVRARRLLLQLEFAHFDYGVAHDRRGDGELRMILPDEHLVAP